MNGLAPTPRLSRALGAIGVALGSALVLVASLIIGLLLHLNLPATRRLVTRELNAVLAAEFKGKVTLDRLSRLRVDGVSGVDVRISAPDGTTVVVARGVRAHIRPIALVQSILRGAGDLHIDVFDIEVHFLEVNLDTDEAGTPKLESTFELRKPSTAAGPGRTLRLVLDDIAVWHALVHGRVNGVPPVDANLDRLRGAKVRVDGTRVTVDVSQAVLVAREMPEGADARGEIGAHVVVPSQTGGSIGLSASFTGTVGGIPTTGKAVFDGAWLDAVLDVPEVSGERIRALFVRAPVYRSVAAHFEAHGSFAKLHTTAHATIGTAELQAVADLALAGPFAATIGLDLRNVDLRALSPIAPRSSLALQADVHVDPKRDGMLHGRFTANVAGGTVDDEPVPPGAFQGDFEQRSSSRNVAGSGGVEVKVNGSVSEPGAPTEVRMDLRLYAPAPIVDFNFSSRAVRLSRVRRLGWLESGSGELNIQGTAALGASPSFDATLVGHVEALSHATVRLRRVQLRAHAFGSFALPEVDATFDAEGIEAAHDKFRHAHLTAAGPLSAERVTVSLQGDGAPDARASATVTLTGAPSFENLDLELSRGKRALHAAATHLKVDGDDIVLEGACITGIGDPIRASLDMHRGSLVVQGGSKGVDLGALGYLLGFEDKLRKGRLRFAIDLSARRDAADGTAVVDIDQGSFGNLDDVSGHFEARMDGRRMVGAMKVSFGDVGMLDVSLLNLEVGGNGPLDGGSWRRTWGLLHIDGAVDLAKAADRLPPNTLPFSKLAGRLTMQGHIRRGKDGGAPGATLALKTYGLRVSPRPDLDRAMGKTLVAATPPLDVSGIDVQVDVLAAGDSGFTEIYARLFDKVGDLVSLDAKSAMVPYGRLFESREGVVDALSDLPFSAVVVASPRKLYQLPDLLRPAGASGDAEARISIDGTYRKPAIDAKVTAHSVQFDRSPLTGPFDADVTAKYDGAAGDIIIDLRTGRNGAVHATAHVNAKAEGIRTQEPWTIPWDASGKATFTRLPVDEIAAMSHRQVRGEVSGAIELTDLHKDARATVDIDVTNPGVGVETFDKGNLKMALDGRRLEASVRLERADAVATGTARMGVTWGAGSTPSVDRSGSVDAAFQSKHFPAAILAPLVAGAVDELEGTIDADAHLSLRPNERPKMDGKIVLTDGLVELTALGEEIHGVRATVVFTPDGGVRLDSLSASGTSGKLTASGAAYVDGLHLARAEGDMRILKGDAMPVALRGASMGTAYGQFDMKAAASSDHKTLHVEIDIPILHIDLPQASTHSVEDLDEPRPQTHLGVYTSAGKFVPLPLGALDAKKQLEGPRKSSNALAVDLHFGQNVEIQRGADLKVDLDGDLAAKLGNPTEVTGQVRLKRGKLDVRGKSFEIETGTVTFLGDPSNPEVRVTASWTAGDGTRVYADYVGPLKTGKLILRSEPSRSQNEILALILFGTADGLQPASSGAGQQSTTTTAGAAVGGFAAAGLNQGLNKLLGVELTAKIDTSGANARPEVTVQIARDISLQLAVVLGALPPGMNQDSTYATIDWRFFKDWSLETTFGNLGTSIADILWQRRY